MKGKVAYGISFYIQYYFVDQAVSSTLSIFIVLRLNEPCCYLTPNSGKILNGE